MSTAPGSARTSKAGSRHVHREAPEQRQPILINGTGEQRRDLVYVADVVDSLLTMARSNRDGTWKIGPRVSTSILELLRRVLEKEIEPATEVRHGPKRAGDVNKSRLAIASIENDLGWRPEYDLADGIVDMIRQANADR
jgi:UDP-glucose 4-epimerase